MSSKINVNPGHYKVAGRERQGEGIVQGRQKQRHAQSKVRERFEKSQLAAAAQAEAGARKRAKTAGKGAAKKAARPAAQPARGTAGRKSARASNKPGARTAGRKTAAGRGGRKS